MILKNLAPKKEELIGKRVYVYYNLHTHTWSVRLGSKVVLHTDYIKLKDVEFRVRAGGREKVRVEQSKNVHAFVIGNIVDYSFPGEEIPTPTLPVEVTYNPYIYNNFVVKSSKKELFNTDEVEMIKRKVYASSSINENIKKNKMKKVIKLNESDIEKLVVKILNETTPKKELERKVTKYRKLDFEPYQRESELKTIFGPYSEDIPAQALEYMRKNPASVIKKLIKIYGVDKVKSYT
jgi:hypothetical protein